MRTPVTVTIIHDKLSTSNISVHKVVYSSFPIYVDSEWILFTAILSLTINYNMYMCAVYTIYDRAVSGIIAPKPYLII
jgi:hypothetical protein